MAQEKRKPFKGKKLHKDLRDYKNQEIKRSLVHRARLRKNYFKLLEKEGIPSGENQEEETEREPKNKSKSEILSEESGSDAESDDSSNENEKKSERIESGRKRHGAPLPSQEDIPKPREVVKREIQEKRKPLNFAERAKLAKDRKEQKREDELLRVQERRKKIEKSQRDREKKKLSLQKRTKRGQPVMGPKINDLLDKIRQNS